jgi:hypothetical protein
VDLLEDLLLLLLAGSVYALWEVIQEEALGSLHHFVEL